MTETNDYCQYADLPMTRKGDTWDGLTLAIASDDTEFEGTLVTARFQLQDSDGVSALTLSSAVSGEVTINSASPGAWSVTVEPRAITIDAGTYGYGLELTDSNSVVKTRLVGTLPVNPDAVI
jgi:hypothetical protein